MESWSKRYAFDFIELIHQVDTKDVREVADRIITMDAEGKDIFAIANGGSFAVTSHLVTDLNRSCGIKAVNFADGSLLTCFSNDFGYDRAFENMLRLHADSAGGLLIAVSSSGQSKNILNAIKVCSNLGIETVALTGFDPSNPVRNAADYSIYVGSHHYNFVEMTHQFILLQAIDMVREQKGTAR